MSTALPAERATASPASATSRLVAIDIIRGAVMVLMAIDHVRVYSGLPAGGPTPGIFFTRWITHFCAPAFVFLAGTSAFLSSRRRQPTALSRHLLVRGAWLILLELTVLRFAWTFNLDYQHYMLAGVIWVIGWSMIVLALLVRLPVAVAATLGLVIIAGHNVLDFLPGVANAAWESPVAWLWQLLYFGGPIPLGETSRLAVLYTLVPWVGVMAAGYAFGAALSKSPAERRRWCLAIGLGAVGLFVVLRGLNLYGNPAPWGVNAALPGGRQMPAVLSFLNTNKYPASLSFLLMTLGPTIALIPILEGARGWLAGVLAVFGRVPFFYYILHIPLIHLLAMGVSLVREGRVNEWLFLNHPMGNPPAPDGYAWRLWLLYAIWAVAIVILYFPSKWFAGLKQRRKDPWLSYL